MTKHNEWLYEWFVKRNPDVNLEPNENYFQQGVIDSLGIIELIEDIEVNYNIQFNSNDFQDRRFSSVNGLTEIIFEKTNNEVSL
jgi:acyl carrier protein